MYTDRWRFIRNRHDVMPGWGNPAELLSAGKNSKDELFISFFSTLHLQLRGKYVVLNCHSNFHQLIYSLTVWGGCGAAKKAYAFCMNDQWGKFRICNSWNIAECREKQKWEARRLLDTAMAPPGAEHRDRFLKWFEEAGLEAARGRFS
jgi:hypothetical protein